MDYKCPICNKVIPSPSSMPDGTKQTNSAYFPFCSQRCRLIDLGAWLEGDYRIASSSETQDHEGQNGSEEISRNS